MEDQHDRMAAHLEQGLRLMGGGFGASPWWLQEVTRGRVLRGYGDFLRPAIHRGEGLVIYGELPLRSTKELGADGAPTELDKRVPPLSSLRRRRQMVVAAGIGVVTLMDLEGTKIL